jgi:hypothetical protein
MSRAFRIVGLVGALLVIAVSVVATDIPRTHSSPGLGEYAEPFFAAGTYRADVQSPSKFLGVKLGSRPLSYDEVFRYFEYLDESFSNVFLTRYATSYEGRELFYLVVTSEDKLGRLQEIREATARLADPRELDDSTAREIIDGHPATAWMLYGIHGDELSSGGAAVQLAFQLVAGTDETTQMIRDNVVVCIDPMQNPDGRERWRGQLEGWNSAIPNSDVQSLHHMGAWPQGRGNHYLFDLNRDWFTLVHPETRGKIAAILEWNPQFLLDCHEMFPQNTYLFSPPREPFNPYRIPQVHKWWDVFSKDQAAAFDRYGWSYYTREWNEESFPGYGSAWGMLTGAIGMLYEQAGVDGSQIKHHDGTVMTYRESIHHHFISSMANLTTAAEHRKELLEDFYEQKKQAVGKQRGSKTSAAFVFPPTANVSRLNRLAETLALQRIEVSEASADFKIGRARSSIGKDIRDLALPKGSLIIRVNQPQRNLLESILTFDIPIESDFLETQRRKLLKDRSSRLYGATGWSMPLAYNLECYYTESLGRVDTQPYMPISPPGRLLGRSPLFGYAIDGADDRSRVLLARLMEKDYKVWAARKPFQVEGRRFGPGSLMIRLKANPDVDEEMLEEIAETTGVDIYGVNTALGGELADFGGGEFVLLQRPRIGIVGGSPTSAYQFGAAWHLIDSRLGFSASTLDVQRLPRMDLRKYNVIVLPSAGGDAYKRMLGDDGLDKLKRWVQSGGTLIAMDGASAFLADSSVAISQVRRKGQVLEDLSDYDEARAWLNAAEFPVVDSLELWGTNPGEPKTTDKAPTKPDLDALRRADELARRLSPQGTILAADLDEEHWLTFGERSPVPLMVATSVAYLAKTNVQDRDRLIADDATRTTGVQVAARFAGRDGIRLSGLLWPEARERWNDTVGVSRETLGDGQIILFAMQPNFRAYFHGGERLLLNAIFFGPGFGARTPLDW